MSIILFISDVERERPNFQEVLLVENGSTLVVKCESTLSHFRAEELIYVPYIWVRSLMMKIRIFIIRSLPDIVQYGTEWPALKNER